MVPEPGTPLVLKIVKGDPEADTHPGGWRLSTSAVYRDLYPLTNGLRSLLVLPSEIPGSDIEVRLNQTFPEKEVL